MLGLYAEETRLADEELPAIPARSVAGLRTHDMEPFAMFYERGDLADYRPKLQRAIGRRGRSVENGAARWRAHPAGNIGRLPRGRRPRRSARRDDAAQHPRQGVADDLAAPSATADVGDARRPGGSQSARDPDGAIQAVNTTSGPPGELDLHLFNEGTHRRIHDFLGAHPDGGGCWFAVWAPNARAVDVVGDFTGWKSPIALEPVAESGVWSGLLPHRRGRRWLSVRHHRRRRGAKRALRPGRRGDVRAAVDGVAHRRPLLRLARQGLDGRSGADLRRRGADLDLRGAPRVVGPRRHTRSTMADATTSSPTRSPITSSATASPTSSCFP